MELFRDAVSWVAHGGKGEEGDRGMSTAVHAVALPCSTFPRTHYKLRPSLHDPADVYTIL